MITNHNLEQQCIRGMKRRAEQETTAIPKVYEQESIKFFMQTGGILPVFNSVRLSLYRRRNSSLPVIPHNLTEFDIPDDWKKDNLGGDFLQINVDTDARLLDFVSQCGLERLAEAKHWNADAQSMKPSLFAALPDKYQTTYTSLITNLSELSLNNNIILNPETIMMDFETAAINSFESAYPTASCKSCYFHYCKNLYKQIGKKGCIKLYQEDYIVKHCMGRLFSLPLLPLDIINEIFTDMFPTDRRLQKFCDYICST
ncbi:unnamed protein product, partial [Didymodactylos carnosus]